jgi:hypothetical protein
MTTGELRDHLLTLRFDLWQTLGWPGVLGVPVLAAAIVMWSLVPGMASETRTLHEEAWQARKVAAVNAAVTSKVTAEAEATQKFPELFSTFASSGNDLAAIFALASEEHLTLGAAQYQLASESGARFLRYQVTLPVKEQYATIRRFIAAVLNKVPNAALQDIHVERPAVDGNQLEARIRFELIYRAERP